jgi:hypothetical protein
MFIVAYTACVAAFSLGSYSPRPAYLISFCVNEEVSSIAALAAINSAV